MVHCGPAAPMSLLTGQLSGLWVGDYTAAFVLRILAIGFRIHKDKSKINMSKKTALLRSLILACLLLLFRPRMQSIAISVFMSVSSLAYLKNHTSKLHKIFWIRYLLRLLGPVMIMQCIMYFGFVDDVMFSHNGIYFACAVVSDRLSDSIFELCMGVKSAILNCLVAHRTVFCRIDICKESWRSPKLV